MPPLFSDEAEFLGILSAAKMVSLKRRHLGTTLSSDRVSLSPTARKRPWGLPDSQKELPL